MEGEFIKLFLEAGNSGIGVTGLLAALYMYIKNRLDKQNSKIENQALTIQLHETQIELNKQRLDYHAQYNDLLTDDIKENAKQINQLSQNVATILALARKKN